MAKKKEIQYPTQEWVDNWVDAWLEKNPTVKVDDFKVIEEKAMDEWWENEIEHDRPTPFDLTDEQEKISKKARNIGEKTKKTPTNYKFDTRKKPKDAEKVEIVEKIFDFVKEFAENSTISNAGREISFNFGENSYSLVLTKHRTPKK